MKEERKDTLFLDRDGVINVQLIGDYVKDVAELKLRTDFVDAIPVLAHTFQRVIIVTNQQGIAKGICTMEQVNTVHQHLVSMLEEKGLHIDGIYVCPHLAHSGCGCRKPQTGMMDQALRDFPTIDIRHSVMIGDKLTDVQFGRNAGVETVYIGEITTEEQQEINLNSDHIVGSICEYTNSL